MEALSHKHRESQALVVRPHVFLSPFAVIWKLALMHWHRLHHKWHHQRSSDNKHGFPKFSTLFSHEATLSHERVPHWNARSTSLAPETPLPPLLGYVIGPRSSRDSSSSDWVWLVFTTNPDTWFHWGRWDLKGVGHGSPNPFPLHSMMHWARAVHVRNACASLLLSPLAFALSVSTSRHNALDVWISVSAPFLTPEIRILRSCWLWWGQFSCHLIKRWRWKWDFGERLSLIGFQRAGNRPHHSWALRWLCRS